MKLDTLRIAPNVKQKFVLVHVIHSGISTKVLWGDPDMEWHKDIVDEIAKSGYDILEVLGGGWMFQNLEEVVVYVWGKSDRYGAAPISAIQEVIKGKVVEGEPI
jgi:hypothetical protein